MQYDISSVDVWRAGSECVVDGKYALSLKIGESGMTKQTTLWICVAIEK